MTASDTKRVTGEPLKICGVSRDGDNNHCILVGFSRSPTDDELRAFHDSARALFSPERPQAVADFRPAVWGAKPMNRVTDEGDLISRLRTGLMASAAFVRNSPDRDKKFND